MLLIVLHGLPGSGKLTIAQNLARHTDYRLFHNHLTVDLLLSGFAFGSPPFVNLRESIWLDVMRGAAESGLPGLVFTFAPERTVNPDFLHRLAAAHRAFFVELKCPEQELEKRLASDSRRNTNKLNSAARYRELKAQGVFDWPGLPASDLTIDTSQHTPEESAQLIADALQLKAPETAAPEK